MIHFSPLNAGSQKPQVDNNNTAPMEILEQMPSSQGKRQGKKEYMNQQANQGKPDTLAEGQGCGWVERGGEQEKFQEIRNFNNFDRQGLRLDTELFLTYCKP